jgi:hypothetical protein
MSGGSMNYVYCEINDAADNIPTVLSNYIINRKYGIYIEPNQCYKDKHPDIDYLADDKSLTDAVIKRLEQCLLTVREAAICAERVEWLTSGDDNEAEFCMRLDKDLAEFRKTDGVM